MTITEFIEYLKNYKEKSYEENCEIFIEIGSTKFSLEENNFHQDWNGNLVIDFSNISYEDL